MRAALIAVLFSLSLFAQDKERPFSRVFKDAEIIKAGEIRLMPTSVEAGTKTVFVVYCASPKSTLNFAVIDVFYWTSSSENALFLHQRLTAPLYGDIPTITDPVAIPLGEIRLIRVRALRTAAVEEVK